MTHAERYGIKALQNLVDNIEKRGLCYGDYFKSKIDKDVQDMIVDIIKDYIEDYKNYE
jgi:hypothetical protein